MKRQFTAYLLIFKLCLVSFIPTFVLKDHAWYTKELKELERLYYYMNIGHTSNINHMSQAGLFKANVGTQSIEVVEHLVDGCYTYDVRFKFKKQDEVWYYTRQEEVLDN